MHFGSACHKSMGTFRHSAASLERIVEVHASRLHDDLVAPGHMQRYKEKTKPAGPISNPASRLQSSFSANRFSSSLRPDCLITFSRTSEAQTSTNKRIQRATLEATRPHSRKPSSPVNLCSRCAVAAAAAAAAAAADWASYSEMRPLVPSLRTCTSLDFGPSTSCSRRSLQHIPNCAANALLAELLDALHLFEQVLALGCDNAGLPGSHHL